MRLAGLEPARLAPTDFKSVVSAIPPQPHNNAIIPHWKWKHNDFIEIKPPKGLKNHSHSCKLISKGIRLPSNGMMLFCANVYPE